MSIEFADAGSWLIGIVKVAAFPLFLSYVAAAAYTFQRRRADIATVYEAVKDMHTVTWLALDKVAGSEVNKKEVHEKALHLISRVRLEMLHRPEEVQVEIKDILDKFLINADVATGQAVSSAQEIVGRVSAAESSLIDLIRQFTVSDAIKQAWISPGVGVNLNDLIIKYRKNS